MNQKRNFLKRILLGSSALLGTQAVFANSKKVAAPKQGAFVHMVYIWLKEPDNKEHQSTFLKNTKDFLKEVDEIVTWYVGTPAQTPRDVVDNSYSFSIMVSFKNREDHDIYQEHAAHKKFIKETSMLWNKVQVYDSIKA